MVKHIVMFKLTDKNLVTIEKAVSALKGMTNRIESLKSLEVGVDYKNSERSYDIVLTALFDNKQGLEVYSNHPIHTPVKQTLLSLCSCSVVVDYEI